MTTLRAVTGDTHALDDEVRSDALDVLTDALQWRMTEPRWAAIRAAVDALATAVRAGDVEAARPAVADLELLGPVRATPIGHEPLVPAPDPVRDEINELVRAMDDDPEQPS